MAENDDKTTSSDESGSYEEIEDFDADALPPDAPDRSRTADSEADEAPVLQSAPDDVEDLGAFDDEVTTPAHTTPASRPMGAGIMLVGLAASMWAAVAVMRCDTSTGESPPLAVVDDAQSEAGLEPAPGGELESRAGGANGPSPEREAAVPPTRAEDEIEPEQGAAPEEPAAPELSAQPPQPSPWATSANTPKVVRYTVRHGGSIKNVANLFKIFHHEITELNPGVALDHELPPKSAVVVYKAKPDTLSQSVGLPSAGSLEGAVPMVEGPGRVLKAIPWKSWGTSRTVALLDAALRQWAKRTGKSQPILVGNMSARTGGKLPPHSTHQSGRDVDLGYLQKLPAGEELNWREMTERNLDAAQTWALLLMLAESGQVEVVYIDRSIQKLLHAHALAHQTMTRSSLKEWMEYPRPTGTGRPLIQHVRGHIDHLHVRFKCQAADSRCRSR